LLQKTGGKTDTLEVKAQVNAAIVVCSDSVSAGKKEDRAGKALQEALQKWNVKVTDYLIVPDEIPLIQAALKEQHQKGSSLIVFTGGTGLSPRDVTPEALRPLLDKTIPGMEEAIRNYGQNRTPYAMLSRSIVGMIGSSLVLGLPGSTKGAEESLNAIFPAALH
jgi:molybdenum cofactor synthesis domain-containing protein